MKEKKKIDSYRNYLGPSFLNSKNYRTLTVPDENYIKYCIYAFVIIFYLFQ